MHELHCSRYQCINEYHQLIEQFRIEWNIWELYVLWLCHIHCHIVTSIRRELMLIFARRIQTIQVIGVLVIRIVMAVKIAPTIIVIVAIRIIQWGIWPGICIGVRSGCLLFWQKLKSTQQRYCSKQQRKVTYIASLHLIHSPKTNEMIDSVDDKRTFFVVIAGL